jgi:hypothetical protein
MWRVWVAIAALLAPSGALAQSGAPARVGTGASVELPTIEVVETSPLAGSSLDRSKVPANVQSLSAADFDHAKTPDLLTALARGLAQ